MAKRKKGRGKGKRPAMTRRDADAKRVRRGDRDEQAGEGPSSEDDEGEEGQEASDPPRESDSDAAADSDAGDRASDASTKPESEHEGEDEGRDESESPASDDEDAAARSELSEGLEWARFLVRFEQKWTWLETRLLFVALMTLTCVLCLWIVLRGMKDPLQAQTAAGTVFRAIAGATILGGLTRALSRGRLEESKRNTATLVAVIVGFATAKLWRGVGIDYAAGWLDWLQEGSALTLMGGLKGISTRLTMTVALVGASLAAGSGSHINIDLVIRAIPKRLRKPVNIAGGLATAAICLAASWGLMDHIAIAEYEVDREASPSAKVGAMVDNMGEQFFMWRKQARLDLAALPRVIVGTKWNADEAMTGREWNEFLESGGFAERYGEEEVQRLRVLDEDLDLPRTPFVVSPHGETRGLMMKGMDLIFPLGFFMMGLRFILRALLIGTGHITPHVEGEGGEGGDREPGGERDADEDGPDDGESESDAAASGEVA